MAVKTPPSQKDGAKKSRKLHGHHEPQATTFEAVATGGEVAQTALAGPVEVAEPASFKHVKQVEQVVAPVRLYGSVQFLKSSGGKRSRTGSGAENFRGMESAGKPRRATFLIKCEPHVAMRLKDVFRKISKDARGTLSLTLTPDTAKDLAWFLLRYPMELDREARRALETGVWSYDARQSDLERLVLPSVTPRAFDVAKPLRDYQARAVEIYLCGKKILCADDLGLGKTLITLGSFTEKTTLPALVVCQTHLPTQWSEKVAEFTPGLRVHIVRSRRPYNLPEADVYIMSYSKIVGWEDLLATGFFRSVTFDECQELRIPTSQKYQAALRASRAAEYCLGLSATPIYNYGNEIWSVIDLIREGAMGTYEEFRREWCIPNSYQGKDRVRDPHALGSFLRENFLVVRRSRAEVGRELPPVNKILHAVNYDEATAAEAAGHLEELAARVISGSIESGQAARELNIQARMMTGIAKAASVADYARILLENGEQVLLMGWHREVYARWQALLAEFHPVLYTGSESPTQKEASRQAFLSGASRLLIMSLRSGVGLDGLQYAPNASIVVFGELDWSPAVHDQVIARLDRDGQTKQVTAIFLHCESGTDPLMVDLLGLKASQSHGIINPTQNELIKNFSDDTKIRLLAEQILKKRRGHKSAD